MVPSWSEGEIYCPEREFAASRIRKLLSRPEYHPPVDRFTGDDEGGSSSRPTKETAEASGEHARAFVIMERGRL
jgi:hypothetical protein